MKYLEEVSRAMLETEAQSGDAIRVMIDRIRDCAGTIYIIGNGGSLTTAEHFALDLRKYAKIQKVWTLGSAAMITAIANDDAFAFTFSRILSGAGLCADDLLIAFTFSGRSRNVGQALGVAHRVAADRILITGPRGPSRWAQVEAAALAIFVPSANIRIVEDVHLAIAHCVAQGIREASQ